MSQQISLTKTVVSKFAIGRDLVLKSLINTDVHHSCQNKIDQETSLCNGGPQI
jgi:hypothetical protein